MHFKTGIAFAAVACAIAISTVAHAELQADCKSDFSQVSLIGGPNLDRVVLGIKASDWTRDDIDRAFDIKRDCVRNANFPDSMKKVMLKQIDTSIYPNAVRALEQRDRLVQQAAATAERQVQAAQATQDVAPSQQQQQATQEQQAAQERQVQTEAQRRANIEEANRQRQEQDERDRLEQQQRAEAQASQQRNLWIVIAVIVAAIAAWGWNRFIRNRCPKCKSTSIELVSEQEVDRWRGSKRITETHSQGTNTRHVSTAYIRIQFDYRCKHCQQEWTKTRQEELGSHSPVVRFFAGY